MSISAFHSSYCILLYWDVQDVQNGCSECSEWMFRMFSPIISIQSKYNLDVQHVQTGLDVHQ